MDRDVTEVPPAEAWPPELGISDRALTWVLGSAIALLLVGHVVGGMSYLGWGFWNVHPRIARAFRGKLREQVRVVALGTVRFLLRHGGTLAMLRMPARPAG